MAKIPKEVQEFLNGKMAWVATAASDGMPNTTGDGGVGLACIPAFGAAGIVPRAIGAQGCERGIVGAAGEVDLHAAPLLVQAPRRRDGRGDCVTATIAAVAESGLHDGGAVMLVWPELERGAAPGVGKLDLPARAGDGLPAEGVPGGQ